MNAELKSTLEKLAKEFDRREDFWQNTTDDPHNISIAVMVAMAESKECVLAALKEAQVRAKSNTK